MGRAPLRPARAAAAGTELVVPRTRDERRDRRFALAGHQERNRLKLLINRLKLHRAMGTLYEKQAAHHEALVTIACILPALIMTLPSDPRRKRRRPRIHLPDRPGAVAIRCVRSTPAIGATSPRSLEERGFSTTTAHRLRGSFPGGRRRNHVAAPPQEQAQLSQIAAWRDGLAAVQARIEQRFGGRRCGRAPGASSRGCWGQSSGATAGSRPSSSGNGRRTGCRGGCAPPAGTLTGYATTCGPTWSSTWAIPTRAWSSTRRAS